VADLQIGSLVYVYVLLFVITTGAPALAAGSPWRDRGKAWRTITASAVVASRLVAAFGVRWLATAFRYSLSVPVPDRSRR